MLKMTRIMKNKKARADLTEGPIMKSLVALSIPIVFGNILQTAYQLVDTFWVGRLGAEAVAAVSLSFPIIFLLISLGGGLAIAGTILVAQYFGKKNTAQVDYISAQTLLMMLFISVIVSLAGYFISEPLMKLIGADAAVLPGATLYLQISFLGMIFLFGFFVYQSLMRGIGEVKTPLYIVSMTVVLNIILDPLFILGYGPVPAYGVAGAALATIFTQGIAAVIGISLLFSGKHGIHLKKENFKLDVPLIKRMFFLGFPASIAQSSRAFGLAVMTVFVATFGTETIAAYGIGGRILSFIIIPAVGLSMATSTLVGQNIGAGKIERAERISKVSALTSFIILTIVGILLFLSAEHIIRAFIPEDPSVIELGTTYIKIMALTFGFMGIQQTMSGTFIGAGDTKLSMILSITASLILLFPVAYILSKIAGLNEYGLWWAFPVSNVSTAVLAVILFIKGGWKKKRLIPGTPEDLQEKVITETISDEGTI
jgi:putative MATE family efflux protein